MSRKRRMFDIEMPSMEASAPEQSAERALEKRRGPMAAAITENAEALKSQQSTEDAIRAENDRLAHEFVRLRSEGFVTERIPLSDVVTERLTRDRSTVQDSELDELKTSISEIGLSNPIRVERRSDGKYDLIQGMRRLSAYRSLLDETGDDIYAAIPAGVSELANLDDSYRRMVDENLVRKDISFAEMGALARAYASDPGNDCPDVDKAVAILFKSASYSKRSYIRAFASLLTMLDGVLLFPNDIPRNVGVDLKRKLDADPGLIGELASVLARESDRESDREVAILREFSKAAPTGPAESGELASTRPRRPKTTFQVSGRAGIAKCSASSGRVDLRYDMDFTRIDRAKLESAVSLLLSKLHEDDDLTRG